MTRLTAFALLLGLLSPELVAAQACPPNQGCVEPAPPPPSEPAGGGFVMHVGGQVGLHDLSRTGLPVSDSTSPYWALTAGPVIGLGFHAEPWWRTVEARIQLLNFGGAWTPGGEGEPELVSPLGLSLATGLQAHVGPVTIFASAIVGANVWLERRDVVTLSVGGEAAVTFHLGGCEIVEVVYQALADFAALGPTGPAHQVVVRWGQSPHHPEPTTCSSR